MKCIMKNYEVINGEDFIETEVFIGEGREMWKLYKSLRRAWSKGVSNIKISTGYCRFNTKEIVGIKIYLNRRNHGDYSWGEHEARVLFGSALAKELYEGFEYANLTHTILYGWEAYV